VVSRNGKDMRVLLLTNPTRHFPLGYEGVPKPTIEVVRLDVWIYNIILEFISGELDDFRILFSSSLDIHPFRAHISTTTQAMNKRIEIASSKDLCEYFLRYFYFTIFLTSFLHVSLCHCSHILKREQCAQRHGRNEVKNCKIQN
jgi:hypothetical protein